MPVPRKHFLDSTGSTKVQVSEGSFLRFEDINFYVHYHTFLFTLPFQPTQGVVKSEVISHFMCDAEICRSRYSSRTAPLRCAPQVTQRRTRVSLHSRLRLHPHLEEMSTTWHHTADSIPFYSIRFHQRSSAADGYKWLYTVKTKIYLYPRSARNSDTSWLLCHY